jgi:hypothetical protein
MGLPNPDWVLVSVDGSKTSCKGIDTLIRWPELAAAYTVGV